MFARRQLGLAEPLLDLRLFRRAEFSASLGAQTFGLYVLAAMQFLTVQYFQLVLGMTPLEAGLWMLPMMVAGIVGTLAAPLVVRARGRYCDDAGFLVAIPGLALMALAGRLQVVIGLAVVSLGIQVVLALTYDLVVGSAPPERAGVASGMGETGTELGIALGVAVAGSLVTAIYRARYRAEPASGSQSAARDTLGGAVAVAEHLPGPRRAGAAGARPRRVHGRRTGCCLVRRGSWPCWLWPPPHCSGPERAGVPDTLDS